MLPVHSAPPATRRAYRRREVLIGAAGALGLALITETASACSSTEAPPPVDPLQAQADLADADSSLARAAASAAPPAQVPALTQVASERSQHSRALLEEIARAAGRTLPDTDSTGSSATSAAPTAAPNATPPPALADVVTALRKSADSAAGLASTLTGYRAGLLGSIAASCTTSATVGLDIPKPAS
jgi:predicted component of type VI protein secretion system